MAQPPLRWRLWEPTARRFVPRRLVVDVCAEESPEGADEVGHDVEDIYLKRP